MTSVTNIRLRVLPHFPASILGTNGITVVREGPGLIVKPDYGALSEDSTIADPAQTLFLAWNRTTDSYTSIAFQSMFDNSGAAAGFQTVAAAELAIVSPAVHALELYGDTLVGDGLGGLYIDSDNGNADTFVSGDGRTWYRAPDISGSRIVGPIGRAETIATKIPLATQRISVLAHTGFIVDYVRDAAGTALTTADGAKWSPDGEAYPQHWGWAPGLPTADQTSILAAMFLWGGECALPRGYTYETDTISVVLTRDISFRVDGVHKASAAVASLYLPMVTLDGTTANLYKMTMYGSGLIDASQKEILPGVASGSAYTFRLSSDLVVKDVTWFAATSYLTARADTAIVPGYCRKTLIDGCRFFGFADHPIYTTGGPLGNAQTISENFEVMNCFFQGNSGCVRLAREHKRATISNNIAVDSYNFVIAAGGATNWRTAEKIIVSGNIIDGLQTSAIDIRYTRAGTAVHVVDNQVYDWGKAQTAAAFSFRGVDNLTCSGNSAVPLAETQAGSTTSCSTGIYITEATNNDEAGTPWYYCHNGSVSNNKIKLLDRSASGDANLGCVTARFTLADSLAELIVKGNGFFPPTGIPDITCYLGAVDSTRLAPGVQRYKKDVGYGIGGADPRSALEVAGGLIVSRKADATRYIEITHEDGVGRIRSRSPVNSARQLVIGATTDASNTTPTGGVLGIIMQILGVQRLEIDGNGYVKPYLPTYANNAAAVTGGVPVDGLYKVSTGEVRARV